MKSQVDNMASVQQDIMVTMQSNNTLVVNEFEIPRIQTTSEIFAVKRRQLQNRLSGIKLSAELISHEV